MGAGGICELHRGDRRTGTFPHLLPDLDVLVRSLAWFGQLLVLVDHIRRIRHVSGLVRLGHVRVDILPRHDESRLVHGVQGDIEVRQQMLYRLDQLEPDLRPEPVAPGGRVVVAQVDRHLVVPGLLADQSGRDCPEGLQVVVDLVPEVLDDHGVVLLREVVPQIEAGRRVSAAAPAVGGCGFGEGVGLLGEDGGEVSLGVGDQGVDRVAAGGGSLGWGMARGRGCGGQHLWLGGSISTVVRVLLPWICRLRLVVVRLARNICLRLLARERQVLPCATQVVEGHA